LLFSCGVNIHASGSAAGTSNAIARMIANRVKPLQCAHRKIRRRCPQFAATIPQAARGSRNSIQVPARQSFLASNLIDRLDPVTVSPQRTCVHPAARSHDSANRAQMSEWQ
jgi:hypothetical protein